MGWWENMTNDAIQSIIQRVLIVLLTSLAAKFHLNNDHVAGAAADLADLIVLGLGVWQHYGMVKVPAPATPSSPPDDGIKGA